MKMGRERVRGGGGEGGSRGSRAGAMGAEGVMRINQN